MRKQNTAGSIINLSLNEGLVGAPGGGAYAAIMGGPDDIVNCMLFLASDEAKYITDAEFTVDGGLTAR